VLPKPGRSALLKLCFSGFRFCLKPGSFVCQCGPSASARRGGALVDSRWKAWAFCAGGVEIDDFEMEVSKVATGQGPFCECPRGRGARQFSPGRGPSCDCPQEENARRLSDFRGREFQGFGVRECLRLFIRRFRGGYRLQEPGWRRRGMRRAEHTLPRLRIVCVCQIPSSLRSQKG